MAIVKGHGTTRHEYFFIIDFLTWFSFF